MRNKFLVTAVIVVGLASATYAAFSQVLTINGTGTATGAWNVAITNIAQVSLNGATENSTPTFTGTSANFDVNLGYPGASATYNVTVSNAGSIDAVLSQIDGITQANAATPTYITYAVTGVTQNSTLAAGNTATAQVVVTWNAASSPSTTNETKTANITLNYAQAP